MNQLPLYAFVTSSVTGETMMIIRGERGLHWDKNVVKFSADELNKFHGITDSQIKAMEIGALFSWDAPGADPNYHEKGIEGNGVKTTVYRRGRLEPRSLQKH
jgi:hypothetical protein